MTTSMTWPPALSNGARYSRRNTSSQVRDQHRDADDEPSRHVRAGAGGLDPQAHRRRLTGGAGDLARAGRRAGLGARRRGAATSRPCRSRGWARSSAKRSSAGRRRSRRVEMRSTRRRTSARIGAGANGSGGDDGLLDAGRGRHDVAELLRPRGDRLDLGNGRVAAGAGADERRGGCSADGGDEGARGQPVASHTMTRAAAGQGCAEQQAVRQPDGRAEAAASPGRSGVPRMPRTISSRPRPTTAPRKRGEERVHQPQPPSGTSNSAGSKPASTSASSVGSWKGRPVGAARPLTSGARTSLERTIAPS